jgi:solute carrier family 25 (mitochondrial carrier protein), member 16
MAFATTTTSNADGTPRQRPSFVRAFRKMYHETSITPVQDGAKQGPSENLFSRFPILKFYRGFTVTIIGMVPYAGTSFLAWGYLRSIVLPSPPPSADGSRPGQAKATPIADLAIGAVSGAVAQTASYPFEVVRRRMQVGGLVRPDRWLTWRETVRDIWVRNGWRGFYVGLSIGFLKIVPMTAVSYAVWQSGKRALGI